MPMYTLKGFATFRDPGVGGDPVIELQNNVTLEVTAKKGVTGFSYTLDAMPPGTDLPMDQTVTVNLDAKAVRVDGRTLDAGFLPEANVLTVNWTDTGGTAHSSTVLVVEQLDFYKAGFGTSEVDYIFQIDGDTLPTFSTPAEFEAFDAMITGVSTPSGTFGPGTPISFSDAGGTTRPAKFGTNGDDTLNGTNKANILDGLDGNDTLIGKGGNDRLYGGNGDDDLRGGNGADFLNPGDNVNYDQIRAGLGKDKIVLTDIATGYVNILHDDIHKRIAVKIDGNANTGTIVKAGGAGGTTTIVDVINPMDAAWHTNTGGLGVYGTDKADSFDIRVADSAWMQIGGGAGNDKFTIRDSAGQLRLDYHFTGPSGGIVANLGTGIVADDGFGSTDTIKGHGTINELRATMFDDSIQGSGADERFILMAGNDTLKAGGGIDTVRYDRTGVDGVTVDLGNGTATGTWKGQAFNHTLKSVENLRGSNGKDVLAGSNGDNFIQGRAGRDKIDGKDGADILHGEDGNDIVIGGKGNDVLFGDKGNDVLRGGAGHDQFVFDAGKDTIKDFSNSDTIQFRSSLWGGAAWTPADVMAAAHVDHGNTVFDFGSHTLTVEGFTDLTALETMISII